MVGGQFSDFEVSFPKSQMKQMVKGAHFSEGFDGL